MSYTTTNRKLTVGIGLLGVTTLSLFLNSQVANADTWTANAPDELNITQEVIDNKAYTLQSGDTLWALSQRIDVSVEDLARLNHIDLTTSEEKTLSIGRVITWSETTTEVSNSSKSDSQGDTSTSSTITSKQGEGETGKETSSSQPKEGIHNSSSSSKTSQSKSNDSSETVVDDNVISVYADSSLEVPNSTTTETSDLPSATETSEPQTLTSDNDETSESVTVNAQTDTWEATDSSSSIPTDVVPSVSEVPESSSSEVDSSTENSSLTDEVIVVTPSDNAE